MEEKTTEECSVWSIVLGASIEYGGGGLMVYFTYPRIALSFVCWSFSNDKWPDVKLSVTYQPIPFLLPQ